jgi:uncharacterized membrane protein
MSTLSGVDIIAPFWFLLCWVAYALFADNVGHKRRDNLLVVMNEYRRSWMRQMLLRDNRMVDAALIGNLLRSISFFANTTIFIALGLFTMLKYRDEATSLLTAIPYAHPVAPILWEAKIFLLAVTFIYAFFKFTWSQRQYNYTCVLVGAAPPANKDMPHFEEYAQSAASLIGNAAKHFNMAVRAYYFGLAGMTWFINPYLFITVTSWVVLVLYRREFRSHALHYLLNPTVFRGEE